MPPPRSGVPTPKRNDPKQLLIADAALVLAAVNAGLPVSAFQQPALRRALALIGGEINAQSKNEFCALQAELYDVIIARIHSEVKKGGNFMNVTTDLWKHGRRRWS